MRSFIKDVLKKIKYRFFSSRGMYFNRFQDQFYTVHQDKLRGTFKAIKKRQKIYIPYLKKLPKKLMNNNHFLDCGCGRGEFLTLLREARLSNVKGVDTNNLTVNALKKKQLNCIRGDAIRYLYLTHKSFYGISAFHLIEHLSFPQLFDFLLLCYKKLTSSGVLILETPNIENIVVSSKTFYYDPTHQQKITSELLKTILEFIGFKKIKFLYLHPVRKTRKTSIEKLIFGAQDFGIIAYKS